MDNSLTVTKSPVQLCIHGHFYQPPRENPFTGAVPRELGAEPYANFNEKINAECYRPNANLGNFERISFNLGPTLAAWLEKHDPETYSKIVVSDRVNYERYGYGNAIAQAYNHAILPLSRPRDARIQIEWGIVDFERRFGHRPEGMWLAETACSTAILEMMAEAGIKFTILAPWQADHRSIETINPVERRKLQARLRATERERLRQQMEAERAAKYLAEGLEPPLPLPFLNAELLRIETAALNNIRDRSSAGWVDEPYFTDEPYLVELPNGRSITVFFYNGHLSSKVSFDQWATTDADRFASDWLLPQINVEKLQGGEPQLLLVATDGELYGHHQAYRDYFLEHLTSVSAPKVGIEVTFLARYIHEHPPRRRIRIHDDSSWSCHHGILRWGKGCECTWGDTSWKPILRRAFDLVSEDADRIFEQQGGRLFKDPWLALTDYIHVWLGATSEDEFFGRHLKAVSNRSDNSRALALRLLRSQIYKHQMYTSCAWFFEDIDRIEPKNALAAAAITLKLMGRLSRPTLLREFEATLAQAVSNHTRLNGAVLFRRGLRWANQNGLLLTGNSTSTDQALPEPLSSIPGQPELAVPLELELIEDDTEAVA
jgi:alpha-amylase/alpha-mannosidase (GH57 family)